MVADMLPDTCIVERDANRSGTSDSHGFVTPSWGTAGMVNCRVDPFFRTMSGDVAEREALRDYYRFAFEYNADVQPSDRLVFGGDVYEIVELHDDHSWRVSRWALTSKIQGP